MEEISQDIQRKECEQCHNKRLLTEFYKHKNKTDNLMRICSFCYRENLAETRRRSEELARQWEIDRQRQEQERRERQEQEERERAAIDAARYQGFPDRECIACKKMLPALSFGYSSMVMDSEDWTPVLRKRCNDCHEEYRQGHRQVNPLCQICNTPKPRHEFLRKYHGYNVDLRYIKICCENCIPRFEALPENEQLALLRSAMVKTYGETAYIYCLHYEDDTRHNHIGRTKHLNRRMQEYRRNWSKEIKSYHVLEEIAFGPMSMERESRWMLHALKHGWPIDNFEVLKLDIDGLGGIRQQAELTKAVQNLEPLTVPYKAIESLIAQFIDTRDAPIVHWFIEKVGLHHAIRNY